MTTTDFKYKGYRGSTEFSLEDNCLHGRILFIDDLVVYEGETIPELRSAFESAVNMYLKDCAATGNAANKPYSGTFNVRIGADLHRKATQTAHKKGIKLNEFVKLAVAQAVECQTVHVNHHHKHELQVTILDGNTETLVAGPTKQTPQNWTELPRADYRTLN